MYPALHNAHDTVLDIQVRNLRAQIFIQKRVELGNYHNFSVNTHVPQGARLPRCSGRHLWPWLQRAEEGPKPYLWLMEYSALLQAWDFEDLQSLGFVKSDLSPQNTQTPVSNGTEPVQGETQNKNIIGEGTEVKKGAVVVTKHLKKRRIESDLNPDRSERAPSSAGEVSCKVEQRKVSCEVCGGLISKNNLARHKLKVCGNLISKNNLARHKLKQHSTSPLFSKKGERRSCVIQKLPIASRTLYHGRTWLRVGPGGISILIQGQ